MKPKHFAGLTDAELLEASKKFKPTPVLDAFLIGFLVGIIIYGVAASTWGFLALIPLTIIYLLLKKPKQYRALQNELKKRQLN